MNLMDNMPWTNKWSTCSFFLNFAQVTVPEGIVPGQAINIIVPKKSEAIVDLTNGNGVPVFNSVESVRDAAVLQARGELR